LKWKVSCEHVYAIYQAYTWYKYWSIVYIRYIPGKLSATFRYQSRYGLVMEYTWYIPGILHDQTVTWLVPKCRRKFWVGVCQVYTVCRHMKGICMFYTRYIPDIYFFPLVYIKYIPGIWHFYWHIPGIYQIYTKYIPGGWCCEGRHGPMPPEPPAITSPGLVITVILFDSPPVHILLLLMWVCTALLDTKNDGKPRFSHE
jgi:hypothetical protein